MKKLIALLSFIFVVAITASFVNVYASTEVKTDIFSPDDYLEFCELSSPIDYSYDGQTKTHVVAEAKRLVIYRDGNFDYIDLPTYNVTKINFLNSDVLLFLSDGKLYLLTLNDKQISDSGFVANYFDVKDDFIVLSVGISFKTIKVSFGDEITLTEKSHYSVEKNYTAISVVSEVEWFCVNEGTLFKFNSNGNGSFVTVANNLKDTRYSAYYDGYYYLTRPSGLYSVNVNTGETFLLKSADSAQLLGNVISPQGVSVYDGMLYVTDYSLNAVSQFDTKTKAFTGVYITSRSDGSERVSAMAEDLQSYDGAVYALDKNVVKIFKDGKKQYKTLPLTGTFTAFSVIGDKMLVTNGNSIHAVNLGADGQAPSLITVDANLNGFTSVTAITSFADNFYFINNTIIDSNPYVEVCEISSKDFKTVTKVAVVQGRGDDICTDIYGKLYLQIYRNSLFSVVSLGEGDNKVKELFNVANESDKINSIVCDFECNVYALLGNNKIARIDENSGAEYYELRLSSNLPSYSTAKDLTVIPATDRIFALFDGFILSLDQNDLNVSSPTRIKKPSAPLDVYNADFGICSLKNETRYFKVDLQNDDGEFFGYTGYSTYSGNETFAVIYSDEKYTLVCNDGLSCIVRTSDAIFSDVDKSADSSVMYYTVDGYAYAYPVLSEFFRTISIGKDREVSLINTFSFNGVKFATISFDGKQGYVPYTMLKTGVAVTDTPLSFESRTISRKGANVYSDKDLTNLIGHLDAFSDVKVYETKDGVATIDYNGTVAYVDASSIRPKGLTVIRNLALITLVLIAIVVTVTFVYKRKYSSQNLR